LAGRSASVSSGRQPVDTTNEQILGGERVEQFVVSG
jgi:hypothetical protein